MTTGKAYAFRPRVTFPIDAQTAGEALDKIRGQSNTGTGELSPEAVVDAAKDAKNPLHAVFEWDDAKAGHQFRVQQAGILIRSVIVTVSGGAEVPPEATQVSVTDSGRKGGASTAHIVTAEELHRAKVERGWKDIEDWRKHYGDVAEFAGVSAALSGFLAMRVAEKTADKKKAAA